MGRITAIFLIIVAVLGGAWYFFVANKEEQRALRKNLRAPVGEAKGVVNKLSAATATMHDPKAAQQCRDNIRNIEMAKRRVASDRGIPAGEVPFEAVVQQMGGALPKCPAGGNYQVNPLGTMVHCTIGTNGTDDPNDDHFVAQF